MTKTGQLHVSHPSSGVQLLQLDYQGKPHALSTALLEDLGCALDNATQDDNVRTIVITGSSTAFATGADIHEIDMMSDQDPVIGPRFLAWQQVRRCPKPMIAAVEGWCLGGGLELAMACDLIIAGESAKFGQPETNLGFISGGGGTAMLTRLVGRSLAMQMILTGKAIDSTRAERAGLISSVTRTGDALNSALTLAASIAQRAPLAMRAAKASIQEAFELSLSDHYLTERTRFQSLMSTEDKQEGISAFREKRPPQWQGR